MGRSAGGVGRGAEGLEDDIFGVLEGARVQALPDDGFDFGLGNLDGHGDDLGRYLHGRGVGVVESRFCRHPVALFPVNIGKAVEV